MRPSEARSSRDDALPSTADTDFERRAKKEHDAAVYAAVKAEEAAARAAAAKASSELLQRRIAELRGTTSGGEAGTDPDLETAARLEAAASDARRRAEQRRALVAKEKSYLIDAERTAAAALKDEEYFLREAAKREELARGDLAADLAAKLKEAQARVDESTTLQKQALGRAETELERAKREAEAAAATRRAREEEASKLAHLTERSLALQRELERADAAAAAAAAEVEAARRRALEVADLRDDVAAARKGLGTDPARINERIKALDAEARQHDDAARAAADAATRARSTVDEAITRERVAVGDAQKLKAALADPGLSAHIAAVVDARGIAVDERVADPEAGYGTKEGIRVNARGEATVSLIPVAEKADLPIGGRDTATMSTHELNPHTTEVQLHMEESSHDVGRLPGRK